MYDPSGSPPSGCPMSHLFFSCKKASSPPVCGCSGLHLCLLEVQWLPEIRHQMHYMVRSAVLWHKARLLFRKEPESLHQRVSCIFHRDILLSAEYQYGISCGNIDLRASVILNSIELMIVAYAPAYLYRKLPVGFLL